MKVSSPRTVSEALGILARAPGPLTPIAGGTDLLVSWHHRPKADLHLLDLSRLAPELRQLTLSDDALTIGALITYWEVLRSPDVMAAFPLLADAARQVGSMQIQTRGTWAGNIGNGSPAADGVPVLLAYDATITLQSAAGDRNVPLCDYWTGYKQTVRRPEELITAIRLPRRGRRFEWFHKVGARRAQTITKVGVAAVRDDLGWRIAANSVAPYVCRCRNLECALDAGRVFSSPAEVRAVLAGDVSPIDDMRSTAQYRINTLARLVYYKLFAPAH